MRRLLRWLLGPPALRPLGPDPIRLIRLQDVGGEVREVQAPWRAFRRMAALGQAITLTDPDTGDQLLILTSNLIYARPVPRGDQQPN